MDATKPMTIQSGKSGIETFSCRIYYEDTDAGGIVYYANYLKYFERARTEWLRKQGVEQRSLQETFNCLFVVRDVAIQYSKPARLDDVITIYTQVKKLGRASIVFHQQAMLKELALCQAKVTVCAVHAHTLRPTPLSAELYATLQHAGK